MTTGRTQRKVRALRCSRSNHLVRAAQPIEDLVADLIVARLSQPDARSLLDDPHRPDVAALRQEASALRTRKDGAATMYAAGEIDGAQLATISLALSTEIDDIEARIEDNHRADVLADIVSADDVRAVWEELDVDRRRAVVSTLMTIKLHSPGRGRRRLDPSSVEVAWESS